MIEKNNTATTTIKSNSEQKKSKNTKIISVGGYLPKRILTNFDLEKMVDTTDEWIVKRTGICTRHIADDNESTSDMAVHAIQDAIKKTNLSLNDIDMIICATTTPDYTFPSTSCVIQRKLNINKPIVAFDIQAVCSGFIYALSIADDMMKSRKIKNAVVVGTDKMSSIIDWKDRNTCVLFGDGAGAVILQSKSKTEKKNKIKTTTADNQISYSIIDSSISADGNFSDILHTTGGVSLNIKNYDDMKISDVDGKIINKSSGVVKMNGQTVFKHAIEKMIVSMEEILERNNYTFNDVDLIIPHQANSRIINAVSDKLNVPLEKFAVIIDKYANTSSASIPIAFNEAIISGKIKKNSLIIMEAFGGGLTWGSVLIKSN